MITARLLSQIKILHSFNLVKFLDKTSIDLIDVSGGTYFPGAASSSDSASSRGPYFFNFAERAKAVTSIPIMLTGGFKTREEATATVKSGGADAIGLARSMVLNPSLANTWLSGLGGDPEFPVFDTTTPGGVTAWYSMRITALAEETDAFFNQSLTSALEAYEARDAERCTQWKERFAQGEFLQSRP